MNVLALTIFVSSILAVFFIVMWVLQAIDRRNFNDRDALLPLEMDAPEPTTTGGSKQACGVRLGARRPEGAHQVCRLAVEQRQSDG